MLRVLRYLTAFALAALVAFGLVFTMQYLIAMGDRTLDDDANVHMVDFVRVKHDETVHARQRKPEKPPPPKAPPPEPPPPDQEKSDPTAEKLAVAPMAVDTDISMTSSGISLAPGDSEYLPVVKVAPVYPRTALQRGIEGWVLLEFTVTKQGSTTNIVVVDSEPAGSTFHSAAIKAAEKFKYKPRTEDGQPIEVPGVRNKIIFQLEK